MVGWEGGPSRNSVTAQEKKRKALESGEEEDPQPTLTDRYDGDDARPKTNATGIEIAAAMATGAPPPPSYVVPPEPADTPRTYRSEASYVPPKPKPKAPDHVIITTKDTLDILGKTFTYFNRAIVRRSSFIFCQYLLKVFPFVQNILRFKIPRNQNVHN